MKQKALEIITKILPETLSFTLGTGLSGLGRLTGEYYLPAVPIGMDLIGGCPAFVSARGVTSYLAYGVGVALPYLPEIYEVIKNV
jgi:hypothetical protein